MFEVAGNDEDDCLEDTLKEDIEIEKPAVAQTTDRGDPVVLDANTVTSSGRKDSLPPFLASLLSFPTTFDSPVLPSYLTSFLFPIFFFPSFIPSFPPSLVPAFLPPFFSIVLSSFLL